MLHQTGSLTTLLQGMALEDTQPKRRKCKGTSIYTESASATAHAQTEALSVLRRTLSAVSLPGEGCGLGRPPSAGRPGLLHAALSLPPRACCCCCCRSGALLQMLCSMLAMPAASRRLAGARSGTADPYEVIRPRGEAQRAASGCPPEPTLGSLSRSAPRSACAPSAPNARLALLSRLEKCPSDAPSTAWLAACMNKARKNAHPQRRASLAQRLS